MKYLIIVLIFSHAVNAKDHSAYICTINKEMKAELSLLDVRHPTVSLVNKNSKIGLCFLETLPIGISQNKKSVNVETVWKFELIKCDYYSEKFQTKLNILPNPSFKHSPGKSPSYFQLLKDQHPLFCIPKA